MARTVAVGDSAFTGGEFKVIPAGTKVEATVFSIDEVAVKTGANAGEPQLDITFKVQGGSWAGREIRYQKVPLYDGPAAWKLVTFAKAVGLPIDEKTGQIQLPDSWTTLLGKPLTLKLGVQKDNSGTDRNQVTGYAEAGNGDTGAPAATVDTPTWGGLNK